MEISVEKYPRSLLGRNKKRFLEREREAALARGVLDIRRPMPMGARVPRVWWSLVERKFACTRTKVRNHDSTERDGTIDRRRKREKEREKEGGSGQRRVPFFGSMCHSCVLSVTREIPRPRSLLELLNRGNRKGNPISREGGGRGPCAWIEDETTKGRESLPFGKYRFEERFSSNLIEAFQISIQQRCMHNRTFSFSSSFFAFRTVFF